MYPRPVTECTKHTALCSVATSVRYSPRYRTLKAHGSRCYDNCPNYLLLQTIRATSPRPKLRHSNSVPLACGLGFDFGFSFACGWGFCI